MQSPEKAAEAEATADRLRFSLITGALGSGKTTLLNGMLRTPELSDAFVLVNEFGAIGIDHSLIAEVTEAVVLLESGCACCALTGDLRDELVKIVDRVATGTWPYGRHVILETTGLADPLPILQLLTSDEVLRNHFTMGRILTAVDVLRQYQDGSADPSYQSQLALADVLVLTKIQMASASDNQRARALIEAANPLALTVEFAGGDEAASRAAGLLRAGNHASQTSQVPPGDDVRQHHGHGRGHHHDHPHDDHLVGISSFALTLPSEVTRESFLRWLQLLAQSAGEDMLRLKGAVPFTDGWHDVNGYGTILHNPAPVAGRDCALPGRLVIIARGLAQAPLQRSLDWACYGWAEVMQTSAHPHPVAAAPATPALLDTLRELLPQSRVRAIPEVLRWNCHNPWSLAGNGDWAWPLLDLLESTEATCLAAPRLGGNINLVSSEIITPATHWLSRQGNSLVADEGPHVPLDPSRAVALKLLLWGQGKGLAPVIAHDLGRPVLLGPAEGDWAVLSVIYTDALLPFDREKSHPANRQRAEDRPLEALASAPIWHVRGARHPATNYARGFSRPVAEWANT